MAKNKMRADGRSDRKKTGAWLPTEVLCSSAYMELTSGAKNVLVAVAAQYRGAGTNNGDLCVSVTVLARYGIKSPDVIWRAEKQLRQHRLLRCTRRGMKLRNTPGLYAITWKPIDRCDGKIGRVSSSVAGNEWRNFQGVPLPLESYDE